MKEWFVGTSWMRVCDSFLLSHFSLAICQFCIKVIHLTVNFCNAGDWNLEIRNRE